MEKVTTGSDGGDAHSPYRSVGGSPWREAERVLMEDDANWWGRSVCCLQKCPCVFWFRDLCVVVGVTFAGAQMVGNFAAQTALPLFHEGGLAWAPDGRPRPFALSRFDKPCVFARVLAQGAQRKLLELRDLGP